MNILLMGSYDLILQLSAMNIMDRKLFLLGITVNFEHFDNIYSDNLFSNSMTTC